MEAHKHKTKTKNAKKINKIIDIQEERKSYNISVTMYTFEFYQKGIKLQTNQICIHIYMKPFMIKWSIGPEQENRSFRRRMKYLCAHR